MDVVLQNALVLNDREAFFKRLQQPLLIPDVHLNSRTVEFNEEEEEGDVIRPPAHQEEQHVQ
jgi:hypothetical protein